MKTQDNQVPQLRLRTNLVAGESLQACQNNLEYWTNQLEKKCSKRGRKGNPGYTPYFETEMQPWQAGDV